MELALEPGARRASGAAGRGSGGTHLGRDHARWRRRGLVRGEANLGTRAEHVLEALAQGGKVVFVDPVHEECVGNFEIDALGADLARGDRSEPGLERLLALEPV